MEIEERIRSRIEAILVNDARNFSEIRKATGHDELSGAGGAEILADERNLYHRIINSYRCAVSEVNKLLEENIGSLSGFYRIVESIKEKEDFQEICSRIVDCLLQDFGAEYGSLLFPEDGGSLCVEAVFEERKLLRIHNRTSLLGSRMFESELTRMAVESGDCLKIDDVYREPRFNSVDFPGVIRSILCLPVVIRETPVGFLILSHSLPSFFQDNHVRVMKILGSLIAHLSFLHERGRMDAVIAGQAPRPEISSMPQDSCAIILMGFDAPDGYGRTMPVKKDAVREIRAHIRHELTERESVMFYGERGLMVLMPGIDGETLSARVRKMREAFHLWQEERRQDRGAIRVNLGFSVCEGDEDLSRMLEVAALMMPPGTEAES
jgi:hypothetical protein